MKVHGLGMVKLHVGRSLGPWGFYEAELSYQPWDANLKTFKWEKNKLLLCLSHSNLISADTSFFSWGLKSWEATWVWWRGPWRRIQKIQVSNSCLCIYEQWDSRQVPCLSRSPFFDCRMEVKQYLSMTWLSTLKNPKESTKALVELVSSAMSQDTKLSHENQLYS